MQKERLVLTDTLLFIYKWHIAHIYDVYTIYGHMLGQNLSSKHRLMGQSKRLKCEQRHFLFFFAKMALVCHLCKSSVAYSHHRVHSTLSLSACGSTMMAILCGL